MKKGEEIEYCLCQYHLPVGWSKKRSYFSNNAVLVLDELKRIRAWIYLENYQHYFNDYIVAKSRYSILVEPSIYIFETKYAEREKGLTISQRWSAKVYDNLTLKLVCKSDSITILTESEWIEWSKQNYSLFARIVEFFQSLNKISSQRYYNYVNAIMYNLVVQAEKSLSQQLGNTSNPLFCWDR